MEQPVILNKRKLDGDVQEVSLLPNNILEQLKFTKISEVIESCEWLDLIDTTFSSIDEKIKACVEAIECPAEYLTLFQETVKIIEVRAQKMIRGHRIKAYAFGSSRTHLGLKSCDLDIAIEIDPTMPAEKALRTLRNIFYKPQFNDVFNRVTLISTAKVPILKCAHILNFECDISVSNSLARHNTDLVLFYISLNKSFRPFLLLIKLWAKRLALVNHCDFKSYTIILMGIFYLQRIKLVPSVHTLQQGCQTQIIEGWNSSFKTDHPTDYQEIKNKDVSVFDLLVGFFSYYATFEFGFYVISPYLGETCRKPLDANRNEFESLRKKGTKLETNKCVCVQDVFQLDFNTASAVPKKTLIKFQSKCADISHYCKTNNQISVECVFKPILKLTKKQRKKARRQEADEEGMILCPSTDTLTVEGDDELQPMWVKTVKSNIKQMLNASCRAEILQESDESFLCQVICNVFHKDDAQKEATLPKPFKFNLDFRDSTKPTRLIVKFSASEEIRDLSTLQLKNDLQEGIHKNLSTLTLDI